MKKIIISFLFFICINIFWNPSIKTDGYGWDDLFIFKKLYSGIKTFYSSLLWVRIDEFYHIKKGFYKDEQKQLNMLKAINRLSPDNHIAAIFLSYMYSRNEEDYKKAISVLNTFIKENPKHNGLHKILGEIGFINIVYLKDYNSAESALQLAVNLSINTKKEEDDPVEYLFYGNYIRMLRTIYRKTDQKEKFQQMDIIIKELNKKYKFKDENFVEKHPVYSQNIKEHDIMHDHVHEHHSHDHFEELFIFQKNYLNMNFLIFSFLAVFCFFISKKKKSYEN